MTEKDIKESRDVIDTALYNFIELLGYNADDYDYSEFNNLLDNLEGGK